MYKKCLAVLFCMAAVATVQAKPVPGIKGLPAFTGTPVADGPRLLHWPMDQSKTKPDLTDQSGDRLYDLHGRVSNCRDIDLILSTEGNYNMALGEYWQKEFLKKYAADIKSWYYTTSPPISFDQIKNTSMTIGNLDMACRPQLVVANKKTMAKLTAAGMLDGKPVAIKQTRGNVILVKKGNPKHIKSIWDLGRKDVRVVTP
ncbi:MAG: substrate-binding domain-containing protein, partial [Gammaproteobacteria bacterium]